MSGDIIVRDDGKNIFFIRYESLPECYDTLMKNYPDNKDSTINEERKRIYIKKLKRRVDDIKKHDNSQMMGTFEGCQACYASMYGAIGASEKKEEKPDYVKTHVARAFTFF